MEYHAINLMLIPILLIFLPLLFLSLKSNPKPKLPPPPGPKPWPFIGHIHLLGDKPHKSITKLCQIYGPIMSLKLGSITTIVISSPDIAKEMFVKHDLAFSTRHVPDSLSVLNHDKISMVWLPVCPKWRHLRKIASIQLFTNQRLDASQGLRRKKMDELVDYLKLCCENGQVVDIGKAAFTTSLNLLSNTILSVDLCSYDVSKSGEFKDLFWHVMEEVGRPNVSDFFPLLKPLDLQEVRRRSKRYWLKILGVFEEIIEERLKDLMAGNKNDVLDILLKLVEEKELSLDDVKHMLFDLFVAGTDTTATTLEWAMTESLRHSQIIASAQTELNQVIGENKLVLESDISKLPYIQAIVKETMRLHPPAPFLLPHKTNEEIQVHKYCVPKNTQVWINIWSIGHDPNIWSNSELFAPERFLMFDNDVKGRDFNLIPFGAGRRICPGMPLAYKMLHLTLATLLHLFNWKLPNNMNPKEMHMEDKFGITLPKAQPLHVIPHSK